MRFFRKKQPSASTIEPEISVAEIPVAGTGTLGSPKVVSEKEKMVFNIHDFVSLVEKKRYTTTAVACHGYHWRLAIHPWGRTYEAAAPFISLFLHCEETTERNGPSAQATVIVAGTKKSAFQHFFQRRSDPIGEGHGWDNFMPRTRVLTLLDPNGALNIHVELQILVEETPQRPRLWRPSLARQPGLADNFFNNIGLDAAFSVEGRILRAHRDVLSVECPTLYDVLSTSEDNDSPIVIEGADPVLFEAMLCFMYDSNIIYDGKVEEHVILQDSTDLLKLADRFGYRNLKMFLEAEMIESKVLTVKNAAEILLLADAHSCALLKAAAMDLVLDNLWSVKETKGWSMLKESNALLVEITERRYQYPGEDGSDKNDCMVISEMRSKLAEMNLDTDGTKQMLIERLKK